MLTAPRAVPVDRGAGASLPFCDLEAQVAPTLENFYDEIHHNLEGSRKAAAVLHDCLIKVIHSEGRVDKSATM